MHSAVTIMLGISLLVIASYACAKTRCLHKVRRASVAAKLAGGLAIVFGLGGVALAAVIVGIPLALVGVLVLPFVPMGRA